jgi:hypothetical protein
MGDIALAVRTYVRDRLVPSESGNPACRGACILNRQAQKYDCDPDRRRSQGFVRRVADVGGRCLIRQMTSVRRSLARVIAV